MGAGFFFNLNKVVYYCLMTDFKTIIMVGVLSFLSFGGENIEVKVEKDECCDCQCEWTEERDDCLYPFMSDEFLEHYRYFGGRKHICIDKAREVLREKDEKGGVVEYHYHFKDDSVVHFCTGEWCPKDCCMECDEFWQHRVEETDLPPIIDPIIPTPPPVSRDN